MASKDRNDYLTETDLKALIKSGDIASANLVFGDEHYLIKNYISKIIDTFIGDMTGFNLNRFDGNVKIQEVYDAATAFPLMSDKRVVTLCDYPFDKVPAAEAEKLLELVSDLPPTTVFLLYYETVEIDAKKPGEKFSKLIKTVKESGGGVFNIGRKTEGELIKLLQNGAARRKCRLELSAARRMIDACSDDLNTLVNELEKLCMFVGEEGTITDKAVETVCSRSVEAVVYNVSKAVFRGDLKSALSTLDDLFYMNTDPVYISTILTSAYIDVYRAFGARSVGKRPEDIGKDFGYGKLTFRLTEAERNLRKLDEKKLTVSLKCLAECDRAVKGGSRISGRTALEKAVVELVAIIGGKEL